MTVLWLAETRDDEDRVLYRIGREGPARVADWPGVARLICAPGQEPVLEHLEGADPARVGKIRQGVAQALIRALDGGVTLHASAVAAKGRAVMVLGPSGAGKSTMASLLCAREGIALLADDMCEVVWTSAAPAAPLRALPGEGATWLSPAPGADKRPMTQPVVTGSARVVAIVCMSPETEADEPGLAPLRAPALFARLVPSLVRFALDDPAAHERELTVLSRLCLTPGYELTRARYPGGARVSAELLAGLLASRYPSPDDFSGGGELA